MIYKPPSDPITQKEFQELEKKFEDLLKKHIILLNRLNKMSNDMIILERKLGQKIRNVETKIPSRPIR